MLTTSVTRTTIRKCRKKNSISQSSSRTSCIVTTASSLYYYCVTLLASIVVVSMMTTATSSSFTTTLMLIGTAVVQQLPTSTIAANTAYRRTTAATFVGCRNCCHTSKRSSATTTTRTSGFSSSLSSSSSSNSILSTGGLLLQHQQQRRYTGGTVPTTLSQLPLAVRSFSSSSGDVGRRNSLTDRLLTTLFASSSSSSSSSSSAPKMEKEEIDPGVVDGTSLRIVRYPHPALRAKNEEITIEELNGGEDGDGDGATSSSSSSSSEVESELVNISKLAKGMLKVMYAAEGVGLAAPQVGVNKRLMVYNPTGDPKKWLEETILVNPKIVDSSDSTDEEIEGCLSFPGMNGEVVRSKWIKVEAMNLRGKKIKKKYSGWEARIFQHEYDHLDGTVYIDRLSEETRAKVQPRLNELIAEFGEGGAV